MSQLCLFPRITVAGGKEWLWTTDSAGWGLFFSRPVGSKGLFYNDSAGLPKHPRTMHGPGEYANEFGVVQSDVQRDPWGSCEADSDDPRRHSWQTGYEKVLANKEKRCKCGRVRWAGWPCDYVFEVEERHV